MIGADLTAKMVLDFGLLTLVHGLKPPKSPLRMRPFPAQGAIADASLLL